MQKSQKILIGAGAGVLALAVAAAVAGPIIYRDFIAPPAADAPSLSGDSSMLEPTGGPLDPAALVGEWSVADGSEAGYRVDEVLNGTDVTVTGRTEQVTGELTVSGLTLESASFEVDVASIATDSANRDDYFRTEALRTDEFPTASFVLTEPITVDAAPAVGEVRTVQATGELTLAGVTKPVTVELQAVLNGATGQVAGSIPITFADFGVEAPNLGFVSVEPNGTVEFSLELSRA